MASLAKYKHDFVKSNEEKLTTAINNLLYSKQLERVKELRMAKYRRTGLGTIPEVDQRGIPVYGGPNSLTDGLLDAAELEKAIRGLADLSDDEIHIPKGMEGYAQHFSHDEWSDPGER